MGGGISSHDRQADTGIKIVSGARLTNHKLLMARQRVVGAQLPVGNSLEEPLIMPEKVQRTCDEPRGSKFFTTQVSRMFSCVSDSVGAYLHLTTQIAQF